MVIHAPITIPFTYWRHEIVVSARINGQGPFTLLLDTDTDPAVVDDRLVRQLKLRPIGASGSGEGIGTTKPRVTSYEFSSVRLDGVTARRVVALSSNLRPLALAFGHRLDGVLGRSFLVSRILQVDFRHRLYIFSTPLLGFRGVST